MGIRIRYPGILTLFLSFLVLSRAYSPAVLDFSKLLILAGRTCWILYVDILVLGKGQFVVFTLRVKN
jgi:exosome complex RNA-binding protein Rrp42 (RNase PH superfamily)